MMEMVNGSRLSNAMRAAGIMRRSLLEAVFHARGRAVFGSALFDKPLMRWTLLEMLLDAEAAASVVLNAAVMFDAWDAGAADAGRLLRIVTPVAKGWITARARAVAGEAMNVRGGNGYVEEWVNARLLRDAYLGAIWEGSCPHRPARPRSRRAPSSRSSGSWTGARSGPTRSRPRPPSATERRPGTSPGHGGLTDARGPRRRSARSSRAPACR